MPITINADDFGKSENVNSAICEAFEKGYIDGIMRIRVLVIYTKMASIQLVQKCISSRLE